MVSGFSRKSSAPRRVALTAISILAWPEISTMGVCTPAFFSSSRRSMPVLPGMTTSERIRSKVFGADEFGGAGGVVADGGFMAGEAEGAGERGQRVGVVVDEEEMSFAWHWNPIAWQSAARSVHWFSRRLLGLWFDRPRRFDASADRSGRWCRGPLRWKRKWCRDGR